jgi:hypothetical protein
MTKALLYYRAKTIDGPHTDHLPGMVTFRKYFKIFKRYAPIDRSGVIRTPLSVQSIFPIPKYRGISKSLEQICNERAAELLSRADAMDCDLYLLWSGGIDSTLVLVSLLKNASPVQKRRIIVVLSKTSIGENPRFYYDHIHEQLRVKSSALVGDLIGSNHLLVNGEPADQIFGYDIDGFGFIDRYGMATVHARYDRATFIDFFALRLQDAQVTAFFINLFERLIGAAPIPIVSNFDAFWWINFTMKWQDAYMRTLSFAPTHAAADIMLEYTHRNYRPFFSTNDFQLWTMNNRDKIIKDDWRTFKWLCKDIIYDYAKDADYRDHKVKHRSLQSISKQAPRFNFIDSSLHFLQKVELQDYFAPDNDFR